MLCGEENYSLSSRKLVRRRRPLRTAAPVGPSQDCDQVAGLFPEQLPASPEPFRNHRCTHLLDLTLRAKDKSAQMFPSKICDGQQRPLGHAGEQESLHVKDCKRHWERQAERRSQSLNPDSTP